jgi:hypothetical protein
MDTLAVACKATTKAEKRKHHTEGCCFECSKQGHITWNCLEQPAQIWTTTTNDTTPTSEIGNQEGKSQMTAQSIASFLKQSSNEDKEVFIKAMQEAGEDMGFQIGLNVVALIWALTDDLYMAQKHTIKTGLLLHTKTK